MPRRYRDRLFGAQQLALTAALASLGVLQIWVPTVIVCQRALRTNCGTNAAFLAPTVIEDHLILGNSHHRLCRESQED